MRITTITDEKNIDQLVERIAASGAAKIKDLRERLLRANPHLADIGKLPPGTPVILPDDPAGAPTFDNRFETAKAQAQQAIDLTRLGLQAAIDSRVEATKATTELLNDARTQAALKADPAAAKGASEVSQNIKEEMSKGRAAWNTADQSLTDFAKTLASWPSGPSPAPDQPTQPPDEKRSPKRERVSGRLQKKKPG